MSLDSILASKSACTSGLNLLTLILHDCCIRGMGTSEATWQWFTARTQKKTRALNESKWEWGWVKGRVCCAGQISVSTSASMSEPCSCQRSQMGRRTPWINHKLSNRSKMNIYLAKKDWKNNTIPIILSNLCVLANSLFHTYNITLGLKHANLQYSDSINTDCMQKMY